MTGRRRDRLAADWHAQMYALLERSGRPWQIDQLLDTVVGRRELAPLEREAAIDAVDRLLARDDVAHGPLPPTNGREAA